MQQRLTFGHELFLQRVDGARESGVGLKLTHYVVELRRRPVVVVRLPVRLREDDLFGEFTHFFVLSERLARSTKRGAAHGESGRFVERRRQVLADVFG